MNNWMKGIIPAMVTPLDAHESIDEKGLRRLVKFLIDSGVNGLFVMGSQGEFYGFTPQEKMYVWSIVVEETNGKIPVFAGVTGITTMQVIELCKIAEKTGVDAVSIMTPFFISPSQNELYYHFKTIADETSLPIVLYNNFARSGVNLSVDLILRLAEDPRFIGIKDSSGNFTYTIEILNHAPESFAVLMGRDSLIFAGLTHGCTGAIAATANVVPKLVVEIYKAFQERDMKRALEAQKKLLPLRTAFELGTFPSVIKEAMTMLGLPAGPAKRPICPLPDDARRKLRKILDEIVSEEESFER